MIIIRGFRVSDLGRVYEIEKKSFKDPYRPLFLLNLYELLPDSFLVAEENGAAVGYIIARICEGKGHIMAIAVDPTRRRRGIGMALMRAITSYFLRNNVPEMWLEVRASNKSGIRFYKSLGFVERGISSQYYSDGESAVILTKRLCIV